MTSFESLYIPHDIFNREIEDNGKGSNLLKVTQQVTAGVKTGPQNLALSLVLFFNTCNCPGPGGLTKHEASII